MPAKYLLISLPTSVSSESSRDYDSAYSLLESTLAASGEKPKTRPFHLPTFKIGTLDGLVQQAEELAKLDGQVEAAVVKAAEVLRGVLEGDEEKLQASKVVNARPVETYLQDFSWNKVKYRADKPIADLIENLHKEITNLDTDLKVKQQQYNNVKTNLVNLQRRQTGNLSTRSLASTVSNKDLVLDSEYLETLLIAVPLQQQASFLSSYETLAPLVVPRSAQLLAKDEEYALFGVTLFKKSSPQFVLKCREKRWTPREFKFTPGAADTAREEVERGEKEERRIWGELLRLGSVTYAEEVMGWVHVKALRVFVESVLRYGLPLEFVSVIVKTTPKATKKIKAQLDTQFSYLGGNAFQRDKKGKVMKDDSSFQQEFGHHTGSGEEYTAFVYYEFEIA